MIAIRRARLSDLPVIQHIELAAGRMFRDIGMPDIAEHPVPSIEVLTDYQRAGRVWVAVDDGEADARTSFTAEVSAGRQPVGFVLVKLLDGGAHVEQVSVDPAYARRRIGRDLVDHVGQWAAARGLPWLSLSTFRDVAWNGPYYERLGFSVIVPAAYGPGMTALMAAEAAHGLDPALRIAMIRPIRPSR